MTGKPEWADGPDVWVDDLTHYMEAVARLRKENAALRAVLDGIARARPARGGLRRLVEQIQQVARDALGSQT